MNALKDNFTDRLSAAATARKSALAKFRAQPAPDDPEVVARLAARQATNLAREQRTVERKAAREARETREAAEEAQRLAEAQAKHEAVEAEKIRQKKEWEERKKAERDIRYAMRKARK